jgi:predicted ArsR family transcriptional regulator
MSQRPNQPETSLSAYKKVTKKMTEAHYKKIVNALKVLKSATYEQIAEYSGLERHAVARRLPELEDEAFFKPTIVFRPGTKGKTTKGRDAYLWELCNPTESFDASEKSVSDYAGDIIKSTKSFQQTSLFS